MKVTPIRDLARRIPEAGRIRTGSEKPAKGMGRAIGTFRFTSSDQEAIEQVAAIYGGKVNRWANAPTKGEQWQVTSEASEIAVVLPPDPLGDSPIYELWDGKGNQRRCDGETCTIMQPGPEGPEPTDVPCLCAAAERLECSPRTRLSVILPDVRFGGVWRYQSNTSKIVAEEMPGMVALIQSLQDRGLVRARLAIEHRKSVVLGETHHFTIPVLRVADTMDALVAGAGRVAALPPTAPAMPALAAPTYDLTAAQAWDKAVQEADVAATEQLTADLLVVFGKDDDVVGPPPHTAYLISERDMPSDYGGSTARVLDDDVVDAEVVDGSGYARSGDGPTDWSDVPPVVVPLPRTVHELRDVWRALTQRQRNQAEKLRHKASLPPIEEDMGIIDVAQWDAMLRNIEKGE